MSHGDASGDADTTKLYIVDVHMYCIILSWKL